MIFNFFCHCKDNDLTKKNKKLQKMDLTKIANPP